MLKAPLLAASLLLALPPSSEAQPLGAAGELEVLVAPRDYLIALPARHVGLGYDGVSPYYDLVVQAIYFVNRGGEPLELESAALELLSAGELLQRTAIAPAEISRALEKASAISGAGFDTGLEILYAAQSTLPEGVRLAGDLTLEPGSAGLADDSYLIVRKLPDELRVTASARGAGGREVRGEIRVPVREYASPNRHSFPVEAGEWFVLAFPGLRGHHRWTASTEHAIDITRVDERGSWAGGGIGDWRSGDVQEWADWHAYGLRVLASADGTVVRVVDDVEFPLDFWNRRAGESIEEYRARIGSRQFELFVAPDADPLRVAGGNHVVIEHPGGEYSLYGHLAHGSVEVEVGQRVVRGQPIARVGGTGEQPLVHLHYQVADRPTLHSARTLPVSFDNVEVNEYSGRDFAPDLVFQPGFFVLAHPLSR